MENEQEDSMLILLIQGKVAFVTPGTRIGSTDTNGRQTEAIQELWRSARYLVRCNSAVASFRSVPPLGPKGCKAVTASSASSLANSFDFSIPTTAG